MSANIDRHFTRPIGAYDNPVLRTFLQNHVVFGLIRVLLRDAGTVPEKDEPRLVFILIVALLVREAESNALAWLSELQLPLVAGDVVRLVHVTCLVVY